METIYACSILSALPLSNASALHTTRHGVLAFIGQISYLGTAFFVFSLVLFPSLFFMGLFTFEWVLQATNAIVVYQLGINRIRHLYLEYAPQMQPYFILSSHDDTGSILGAIGIRRSRWQVFLAPPGMIAVINSVILGVFGGLLLTGLFTLSLLICTSAGVPTFLVSVGMHLRYYWKRVERREQSLPVQFPREP